MRSAVPLNLMALVAALLESALASPRPVDAPTPAPATAAWSGPMVGVVHSAGGISALSIDGAVSAPSFLVGNTQGGLDDDLAAWRVEIASAAAQGVRLFGVCTNGADLAGPTVTVTPRTRAMISLVLAATPTALIIPRIPMMADPTLPKTVIVSRNASVPPLTLPYGSMTSVWAASASARMAELVTLLDAAFPGKIAGVHLAALAAGENRFECPPEDGGYADYSLAMQAEFCTWRLSASARPGAIAPAAWPPVPSPPAALPAKGCPVPTATARCTPPDGSIFAGRSSAQYNLFLSHRVQSTISAHAAAVKAATGGKALVLAFYGYLNELGGHRVACSGHLALAALLKDANVDGIVSPYKYSMDYRKPVGPLASMGPIDSPTLHGKLWVSEDDTRTSVSKQPAGWMSCYTAECDRQLLRRNVLTSALHGAGLYQFDLRLGGWFGRPGGGANASYTATLWDEIGAARRAAERLFSIGAADPALRPEVAVFVDDASMGHLRANGGGSSDDTNDPPEWLEDLLIQVDQIGAPVRHYHLQDLVTTDWESAGSFEPIKLAIFPNAFLMPPALATAVKRFISTGNRTVVWVYAPGVVGGGGGMNASAVTDAVGEGRCSVRRGVGSHMLTSEFVTSSVAPSPPGCPNFAVINGSHYAPTFEGNAGPVTGPGSMIDPWFYLDESASRRDADAAVTQHLGADSAREIVVSPKCVVLARYSTGRKASAFWVDAGDHRAVLTAAPFPSAALRLLAEAAGVHRYIDTASGTGSNGDGIEVGGPGVMVRGGPTPGVRNRTVTLPPRAQGGLWSVKGEDSAVVCQSCATFDVALGPGDTKIFACAPATDVRKPNDGVQT